MMCHVCAMSVGHWQLVHSGFQMTVESNHAIALVLVLVAFLMGSKKMVSTVITQPVINKVLVLV